MWAEGITIFCKVFLYLYLWDIDIEFKYFKIVNKCRFLTQPYYQPALCLWASHLISLDFEVSKLKHNSQNWQELSQWFSNFSVHQSPEGLFKTWTVEGHSQSFRFNRSRKGPKNLHFTRSQEMLISGWKMTCWEPLSKNKPN